MAKEEFEISKKKNTKIIWIYQIFLLYLYRERK
jgi:hypothetical protein